MKKIALLIVMVFAFSLTQAGNHVMMRTAEHNNAMQQFTTAVQGVTLQTAPVFEAETHAHQASKTKRPKADKKPKVKKEKQHKTEAERKADHEQKEKARKAEHQKKEQQRKAEHPKDHKGNHHHHKKENK